MKGALLIIIDSTIQSITGAMVMNVLHGKLQLIDAGNTMMLEEPVSFTFTREGKWNQFTINTGSQINAGNYKVRLVIEKAKGLAISGIDVQ